MIGRNGYFGGRNENRRVQKCSGAGHIVSKCRFDQIICQLHLTCFNVDVRTNQSDLIEISA